MATQPDTGRSSLGRLVLLALTFAAGYVLGSRRGGGESEEWREVPSEPTEITIENGDEEESESEG